MGRGERKDAVGPQGRAQEERRPHRKRGHRGVGAGTHGLRGRRGEGEAQNTRWGQEAARSSRQENQRMERRGGKVRVRR